MAFDERSDRILNQLRRYLTSVTDEHARTTVAAWARAWDDVAPELAAALDELAIAAGDKRLTRSQLIKARRLNNALDVIESRLSGLVDGSGRRIIGQLRQVVDNAGHTTDSLVASQLPQGESDAAWSRVDRRQVDAIVERTTERITKTSFPLSAEATASIKRNLIRGMLVGSNPREVARRAVRQAERGFNGGLTRALTIARTEMLDAHRAAARLGERAHTDVLVGWIWTATLGNRTCPACWSLHGSEHALDEPGPNGHQNCRCVRVPKTKSWRELGFGIDEPPSLLPNAPATFNALSRTQQIDILGPSRFKAWTAGRFPMERWAVERDNTGWRKSWVTAALPTGFRTTRKTLTDQEWLAKLPVQSKLVKSRLASYEKKHGESLSHTARLVNPKYSNDPAHQINCQRVVNVFELRMRGFEATASGYIDDGSGVAAEYMTWIKGAYDRVLNSYAAYVKPGFDWQTNGSASLRQAIANGAKIINDPKAHIVGIVEAWPVGSRGFVRFGRPAPNGGHVFNVVRTEDGVQFVDAQPSVAGGGQAWLDAMNRRADRYFTEVRGNAFGTVGVCRVDDLELTGSLRKAVE